MTVRSTPPLRAWFAPFNPWPWFHAFGHKDLAGSGTPQRAISPQGGRRGYDPCCSGSSNSSGLRSGFYPSTQGAVLNLSAAQIASAGAFAKDNQQ